MNQLDAYLADCYFARTMRKGSWAVNVQQLRELLQEKPDVMKVAQEHLVRLNGLHAKLGDAMASGDYVGSVHRDALLEATALQAS